VEASRQQLDNMSATVLGESNYSAIYQIQMGPMKASTTGFGHISKFPDHQISPGGYERCFLLLRQPFRKTTCVHIYLDTTICPLRQLTYAVHTKKYVIAFQGQSSLPAYQKKISTVNILAGDMSRSGNRTACTGFRNPLPLGGSWLGSLLRHPVVTRSARIMSRSGIEQVSSWFGNARLSEHSKCS
jgi:hypothetical protein